MQEKSQNITLVLVDTWATLETHSIFFEHIRAMGGGNHTLEFKLISGSPNEPVGIQQFNKYFYDNIILMAPTVKSFGQDLKIKHLLEFVDFHHNLMVFLDSNSRKVQRSLANEFGVDFEDYGFSMEGGPAPVSSAQTAFKQSRTAWSTELFEPLDQSKGSGSGVFTKPERPVLFEDGVGAVLDTPKNNQHVFPILRAAPGSYSYNPSAPERSQIGLVSGKQLTLVAGY